MARGTNVTNQKRQYDTAHEGEFAEEIRTRFRKIHDLRYGENPNQHAAIYHSAYDSLVEKVTLDEVKSAKGGLSATNYMDIMRGMDLLKYFDRQAVAVMKHAIPSGFSVQYQEGESLQETYIKARDADSVSAYGSIVVVNREIDRDTAQEITKPFIEVVAAPGFSQGVMDIFEKKKKLRVVEYKGLEHMPKFIGDDVEGAYELKVLPGGRVIFQKPYLTSIRSVEDLVLDPLVEKKSVEHVVKRDPTASEVNDLLTAWYVNIGVRSNGIVMVKDGTTVAVGSGQTERVRSVKQSIVLAYQKAMDREGISYDSLMGILGSEKLQTNPLEGAVMSSDAFFPFRDSIDLVGEHGVSAIIQPGGSERDGEVIDAVNKHNIAMAFTRERCFGHF